MKLWTRSVVVAACLVLGVAGPAAPSFADGAVPTDDPPPAGAEPLLMEDASDTTGEVTARATGLFKPSTGAPASSIQPGEWFYVKYTLTNHAEREAQITGVASRLWTTVHPDLQGEYPIDHCDQFLESRERVPGGAHVNLPDFDALRVAPGATSAEFDDDRDWRMRGGAGNACQRLTFYWGATPSYEFDEPVQPVAVTPQAPVWAAGRCEATTPIPGTVDIPIVEGVRYTLNGEPVAAGVHKIAGVGPPPGAHATVAAVAADGYVLAEGATAEWAQGFPELQCDGGVVPPPTDPGEDPDPELPTDPAVPEPQPDLSQASTHPVLAKTGADGSTSALALGALLTAAGLATVAVTRARSRRHG